MSRSGYSYDGSSWDVIRWRGMVASATRGKRGQSMLTALLAALDAMPEKRLIADELEAEGQVCALGALGRIRGLDMSQINAYDRNQVALVFDIAPCLAAEIVSQNDEGVYHWVHETPEQRWTRMRAWVAGSIRS